MIAARYHSALTYDPRMAGGEYRLGAPRNALAALMPFGRLMQSANHLLQLIRLHAPLN